MKCHRAPPCPGPKTAGSSSGSSPGFGITLVAETTSGCLISAEACAKHDHVHSVQVRVSVGGGGEGDWGMQGSSRQLRCLIGLGTCTQKYKRGLAHDKSRTRRG